MIKSSCRSLHTRSCIPIPKREKIATCQITAPRWDEVQSIMLVDLLFVMITTLLEKKRCWPGDDCTVVMQRTFWQQWWRS
eukprot:6208990-Pleurochrysis_carterae.AAC.2